MTPTFRLHQGKQDSCIHPLGRESIEAHSGSDLIRSAKANPRHFAESVGVVFDNIHCLRPIFPEQLYRSIGRYAVGRKKGHHVAGTPVGKVRVTNSLQLGLTDPRDGKEPVRLLVQYLQCHIAKCIIDAFSDFRADSLDLSGREIGDHAFPRRNNDLFIGIYLKLQAMLGIF